MVRQRIVALVLLFGVVGLVAVSPAHAQLASHASISAPAHHVELPPLLPTTLAPRLVTAPRVFAIAAQLAPCAAPRSAALYLRNRTLLL